jgi:hypothetical protein
MTHVEISFSRRAGVIPFCPNPRAFLARKSTKNLIGRDK